jgi:type IV secretion system protein VirB10
MIAKLAPSGRDPRRDAPADDLGLDSVRSAPQVGRPASAAEGLGLALGIIGAAAIGGFTILELANHHAAIAAPKATVEAATVKPMPAPLPVVASPMRAPLPLNMQAPVPQPLGSAPPAPLLVVDDTSQPQRLAPVAATAKGAETTHAAASEAGFSPDEQFAARAGDERVPTSHAQRLAHPSTVVTQGTLIPAVLETALNSELPGYARALVSRDVRSFDGNHVLIPRGSRLVGQYKSALQAGQKRAFIVWNRLLRPDGVSILLGSPATDDVGQAGLAGKVNSHFFQRFGSAILLSVIDGLTGALGGSGNNTVVLGSVGTGTSSAAGIALQNQIKISPTVKVMQGAPIQVFVARDLDFTEDNQ